MKYVDKCIYVDNTSTVPCYVRIFAVLKRHRLKTGPGPGPGLGP